MFQEFYDKDELIKIKTVINQIEKENIKDIDTYLRYYLSGKEILLLRSLYFDNVEKRYKFRKQNSYNKIDPLSVKVKSTFELEWEEVTPYTILGIEEKEYTKEELLEIVKNKINFIKSQGLDKVKKEEEINKILDSYNEIIGIHNKKK